MQPKVLIAGSLAIDQIKQEGSETRLHGGCGGNIAYGLAQVGVQAAIATAIGDDEIGREYLEKLFDVGVDTSLVTKVEGAQTRVITYTTPPLKKDNSGTYPHPDGFSLGETINPNNYDLVFISSDKPEYMVNAAKRCRDAEKNYVLDLGQGVIRLDPEQIREMIKGAFAMFLNRSELDILIDSGINADFLKQSLNYLVVTDAENGVTLHIRDIDPVNVTAHKVPGESFVDSIGCGDAFRAGFFSSVMNSFIDFSTALLKGSEFGALAAQSQGGQSYGDLLK